MSVSEGDTVQVHYKGTLKDGTVFDESDEENPLEFTVGSGQIIPGFEEAVKGMDVEEEKTVSIEAAEAYGEHDQEKIQKYSRDSLPDDFEPQKGQVLALKDQEGREIPVSVVDFDDETITVDLNHPLAGRELTFEIKVVDVE